jgi:hypothetical protein
MSKKGVCALSLMDTKQRFVLISAAALGMLAAGLQLSADDDRSAVVKRIPLLKTLSRN